MINIEEYDESNIIFLKGYLYKKEQKVSTFLVKSLESQVKKLRVVNKETLMRMDKLSDLTNSVVYIDNVELFLSDGTINESSYKDIKNTLYESSSYRMRELKLYSQVDSIEGILKVYKFNREVLGVIIENYKQMMKFMKEQERSIKKFIRVLYEFNFTKAKKMSKSQIEVFFKSKFKDLDFY